VPANGTNHSVTGALSINRRAMVRSPSRHT
jgi:hypothetical protein